MHHRRRIPRRQLPKQLKQRIHLTLKWIPIVLNHPMPLPQCIGKLHQPMQPFRDPYRLTPKVAKLRRQQCPPILVVRIRPKIPAQIRRVGMERRPSRVLDRPIQPMKRIDAIRPMPKWTPRPVILPRIHRIPDHRRINHRVLGIPLAQRQRPARQPKNPVAALGRPPNRRFADRQRQQIRLPRKLWRRRRAATIGSHLIQIGPSPLRRRIRSSRTHRLECTAHPRKTFPS